MKTKINPLPLVIIAGASAAAIAITAYRTPISKLLPALVKTEQQEKESQWQLTANVYETTWDYTTPSGADKIGFILTLSNGTIRDVQVKVYTKNAASAKYQSDFAKALPKLVVGKKLSDIASLDTVSGASGTTKNFKDAVASLARQVED